MNETLFSYRRFVVTGLLIVFSLVFLSFFEQSATAPQNASVNLLFQNLVVSIAFFLVIPFLYSKKVFRS